MTRVRKNYLHYGACSLMAVLLLPLNAWSDSTDLSALQSKVSLLKAQITQQESYQCEGTAGYPACKDKLDALKQQYAQAVAAMDTAEKELREDSDVCSQNAYKDCYRGIKWGAVVDKATLHRICPGSVDDSLGNSYTIRDDSSIECDHFLMKSLVRKDIWYNGGHMVSGGADCPLITMNHKLVGFYYSKKHSSDEILYLLGVLKKKYGKQIKSESCRQGISSLGVTDWSDTGGLNIYAVYPKGYDGLFFVRYLDLDVFNQEAKAVKASEDKASSDADDKRTEGLGSGL